MAICCHQESANQRDCKDGRQGQESGLGQTVARVQSTLSAGPFPSGGKKGFDSSSLIQMEGSHRQLKKKKVFKAMYTLWTVNEASRFCVGLSI